MESPTARERRLQRRREKERAHRAAETAAEKDERLRKRTLREIRRGELWRQKNRELQRKCRQSERFLAEIEEQQKVRLMRLSDNQRERLTRVSPFEQPAVKSNQHLTILEISQKH